MSTPLTAGSGGSRAVVDGLNPRLSQADVLCTLAIFLYWLVYENVIFFYPMEYGGPALFGLTNAIKLLLPLGLLAYTGIPSPRLLTRGPVGFYVLFFATFLMWGLVPTLVSGDPWSWLKLLPRLAFFLSVAAFFSKRPNAFALYAKCIVLYVLSALVQYVLIYATGAYANGPAGYTINPLGLIHATQFPGAPFAIVRLCGFWNEPSNASGSAFAAFFLARYLVNSGDAPKWRWASRGCFVAGVLALANAGYLALAAGVLFGLLAGTRRLTPGRVFQITILVPTALSLVLIVAFGRAYVLENMPDNIWARALTGVRDSSVGSDVTGGRVELLKMTVGKTGSNFVGAGIQEVGSGGIEGSATAPIYWLLLTGVPGLLLLLSRETVLIASARSLAQRLPLMLPVTQALVAVMAQQLSYGTWMNPNYLALAAMVVVSAQRSTRRRHQLVPVIIPGSIEPLPG
ncbi:MAG: hypothetical protein JWM41_3934 [Gemmatimonadetes bacterium]|nr:hypothetical protein [Gemmatimonadota bacterium]